MKVRMNKPTAISVMAVLSVLIFYVLPAEAVVVDIPDPELEAAIRDALSKPTGDITDTDLAGLTVLNAPSKGIVELTGLEYCVKLEGLHLPSNSISDLGPLSGLTSLERLTLGANSISDLGPLSGSTSLTVLGLAINSISDLGPLSGLTSLERLSLAENSISYLGPLSGLTNLVDLSLQSNNISDIQPLVDNPGLDAGDTLYIWENPLSCKAITVDIPILEGRDVFVAFDDLAFLHVSIHPPVLNLKSKAKWITCYIRSPEGCDLGDIDVASIRLEDTLEVQGSRLLPWGGMLTVKFDRSEVLAMLEPGDVELTLTGQFNSGLEFQASDTIRVIDPPAWW